MDREETIKANRELLEMGLIKLRRSGDPVAELALQTIEEITLSASLCVVGLATKVILINAQKNTVDRDE